MIPAPAILARSPSAAVDAGRAGESASRKSAASSWLPEPPDRQRSHLSDAVIVAIHVHDAEVVVECGLRDEEIRDRRAVPHAVMMGQVTLEAQGTIEDVARRCDGFQAGTQIPPQRVVVACGSSRVELFELADRTDEQRPGKRLQLTADRGVRCPGRGALVEHPSCYLHMSSDVSTPTSI